MRGRKRDRAHLRAKPFDDVIKQSSVCKFEERLLDTAYARALAADKDNRRDHVFRHKAPRHEFTSRRGDRINW